MEKLTKLEEGANLVFGEIPVTTKFKNKSASPDELVEIANRIWVEVEKSGVEKEDDAGNKELLSRLQKEFKDFNLSFPITLRWMVQLRKYSEVAFRKFLLHHAAANLSTREGFLELQAEYLVQIYKHEHKHPDERAVKAYRKDIVAQLIKEDKDFLEKHSKAEKEIEEEERRFNEAKKRAIYDILVKTKKN